MIFKYFELENTLFSDFRFTQWYIDDADHSDSDDGRNDRSFCKWCSKFQPERTRHCQVCRSCTLTYDHHNPLVNNCVGHRNRKAFYLFQLYAALFWNVLVYWGLTSEPGLLVVAFNRKSSLLFGALLIHLSQFTLSFSNHRKNCGSWILLCVRSLQRFRLYWGFSLGCAALAWLAHHMLNDLSTHDYRHYGLWSNIF